MLVRELGWMAGKTRFQKLVCLLEARAKSLELQIGFPFELYLHGPYSRELTRMIESLVRDGMLEEKGELTPAGNIQFGYSLTPEGAKTVEMCASVGVVPESLSEAVRIVVQEAGYLSLPDLIDRAYEAHESMSE